MVKPLLFQHPHAFFLERVLRFCRLNQICTGSKQTPGNFHDLTAYQASKANDTISMEYERYEALMCV